PTAYLASIPPGNKTAYHQLFLPFLVSFVSESSSDSLQSADYSFRYRSHSPKARLILLTGPFLEYLRADGIVLPPELQTRPRDDLEDDSEWGDEDEDPSKGWEDIHIRIREIIKELDGNVVPKLNWSAPKDATWISATNNMECRTPNDIYLLLK